MRMLLPCDRNELLMSANGQPVQCDVLVYHYGVFVIKYTLTIELEQRREHLKHSQHARSVDWRRTHRALTISPVDTSVSCTRECFQKACR